MPNLTLKDVPPAVHRALRARAVKHRRSLNSEAIACLEAAVTVQPVDIDALLATAREARSRVRGRAFASGIRRFVRAGRP